MVCKEKRKRRRIKNVERKSWEPILIKNSFISYNTKQLKTEISGWVWNHNQWVKSEDYLSEETTVCYYFVIKLSRKCGRFYMKLTHDKQVAFVWSNSFYGTVGLLYDEIDQRVHHLSFYHGLFKCSKTKYLVSQSFDRYVFHKWDMIVEAILQYLKDIVIQYSNLSFTDFWSSCLIYEKRYDQIIVKLRILFQIISKIKFFGISRYKRTTTSGLNTRSSVNLQEKTELVI